MTGCGLLCAACGVVGAVCRACVWRASSGVYAVMFVQCAVVGAVRDVVRVCGACVSVFCHDADVVLCWVGLVASCVSVRACWWCDGSGECGASRHVRGVRVAPTKCEASWLRHTRDHRRDVRCASWACFAGAVSSAVSGMLCHSIAIAALCCRVCVAAPRLVVAAV